MPASIRPALVLAAGLALLAGCEPSPGRASGGEPAPLPRSEALPPPVIRDWGDIAASDTLRVLLASNSTSYFIYRGEPMGYEHDLLSAVARDHGLAFEVVVVDEPRDILRRLNRGEGDVAAARLVPLPSDTPAVAFTTPLYSTRPVLLEAAAEPGATAASEARRRPMGRMAERRFQSDSVRLRARLLRPPTRPRRQAFVPEGSEYEEGVVELTDSAGATLEVVELRGAGTYEDLIARVASGEVRLTVSPENLARLSDDAFTEIPATVVVGPEHGVAWAVRRNAPALLDSLDAWLASEATERERGEAYFAYFVDRAGYRERTSSEFFSTSEGTLSPYDTLLAEFADSVGWDWRLLASQAYQESRFDPRARSWAGARGLLQLMPRTAREVGVRDATDPRENLAGAARYLAWLDGVFADEITDPDERQRFVLGAYNGGVGHIRDAQRLAQKYGADPRRWDDVAYWLLQKSKRQYYRDPVVRFGYVRGSEPVNYVNQIVGRFGQYRSLFREPGAPRGGRGIFRDTARAGGSTPR